MPLSEKRPRTVTSLKVHGETLDACLEAAQKDLDKFFKGREKYEILNISAHPSAQALGGSILLWEAEIEAGAVWG